MNRAVVAGLEDAERAYAAKGILVVRVLEARGTPRAHGPVLHQAVYTLFRGLAGRLAEGAILYVSTRDLPNGDVELAWEARESDAPPTREGSRDPGPVLRAGPYGDLFELAVAGLQALCRAEGDCDVFPEAAPQATSSALESPPRVRRRFRFVLPGAKPQALPPE